MLLNAAIATRMMTAITRASRTRANQRRTEPPTDRCGLAATGSSFGCLCGRRGRPGSRDIASQLFRRRTRSSGSAHERLKTARKSAVVPMLRKSLQETRGASPLFWQAGGCSPGTHEGEHHCEEDGYAPEGRCTPSPQPRRNISCRPGPSSLALDPSSLALEGRGQPASPDPPCRRA